MLTYKFKLPSGDVFSIPATNAADAWRKAIDFLDSENQLAGLLRLEAMF